MSNSTQLRSRKNLTRFTYETTAFQGWRLCVSKNGTTFTKYFSDRAYGTPIRCLNAAEDALTRLREILATSRRVNGKITQPTIDRCRELLKSYK